jgi:predicted nucleic acid-binding Zn ribbon protein
VFVVKPHGNGRVWCSMACCNRTKRATGQRPKVPPKTFWKVCYGTCEICGALWCGPGGRRAPHCAREECRKEAKNRKSRARYAVDPTKAIERAALTRATRTDEERARESERLKAWWAQFPEAMCAVCGKPTGRPTRKDRERRTCSNACRYALQPPRQRKPTPLPFIKPGPPIIKVACRRCTTVFTTDVHTKLYCSKRCRTNKDHQVATVRQATCARCAQEFSTDRSWQVHCSPRCTKGAHRDRREAAERATSTAVIDRVNRGAVYTRDGFICQLCDYPTNPDVAVPDYEAPTIDHIVPLARGGSHTMDNVQTAHFLCNMLKSDSLAS